MIAAQVISNLLFWIAFFHVFGKLADMNRKPSLLTMSNLDILFSEALLSIMAMTIITPLVYFSGGKVGAAVAFCLFLAGIDMAQAFVMARSGWDDTKMNKFRAGLGLATGLYTMVVNQVFYGHLLPKMVAAVN